MKKGLLKYIACPVCKSTLTLKTKQSGEIYEGELSCSCGRTFPIQNGVPRLLPDDLLESQRQTAKRFGYQWNVFNEFDEGHKGQFLKWLSPTKEAFFKDKIILDAGCGKGRHLYFSSRMGAKEVIGIDLSHAVDAAYENVKDLKNVHVIQADIYNLPFREKTFDFAYSLGVLHHLERPKSGFKELLKYVKKKGRLSAWVYGRENNSFMTKLIEPIRIHITRKMHLIVLRYLSFLLTVPLFLIIKMYAVLDKITSSPSVSLPYYNYFLQFSKFTFRHSWMNVLDKLLAPLANYYTKEEFEKWFIDPSIEKYEIRHVNNISWAGHAYVK